MKILKILLGIAIAAVTIISIATPLAGTFADVAMMAVMGDVSARIPLGVHIISVKEEVYLVRDRTGREEHFKSKVQLPVDHEIIVNATYDGALKEFHVDNVLNVDPFWTLPFIPGLEERARIMFFHVPMSFIATIAFFVAAWFALMYLRKRDLACDIRVEAAASIGLLTTILATVTGSIWAKFNWGSFWNWDPRETSILILMLIYGAYFALRSAIVDAELRARLSAAYALIAVVAVPFLVFILPRITNSLHPGGAGSAAPVINSDGSQNIDARMRIVLYTSFLLFLFLFAWIYRLKIKIEQSRAH